MFKVQLLTSKIIYGITEITLCEGFFIFWDNTTNNFYYIAFHVVASNYATEKKIMDYELEMLGNKTFNHDAACHHFF